MSDVNDAPDTGPADEQNKGGKPGDRPLPPGVTPLPDGTLPDLDKKREEEKYDVFPDDDGDADNRHDDEGGGSNDDPV